MPILIDLPGKQGVVVDSYAVKAIDFGTRALAQLAASAVARYLRNGAPGLIGVWRLFDNEEIRRLVQVLAATVGTAELLGRSHVRQQWVTTLEQHGELPKLNESARLRLGSLIESWVREGPGAAALAPMTPDKAIDYFRNLTPALGIDPERFGDDLRRRVFTMAVATDQGLLGRVQSVIAQRLQTGQGISTGPADIQDILDQVGVTTKNNGYSSLVFRTNTMDSYNQARTQELRDPDVSDMFPVWEYVNPVDARSRPEHAARNGRFYPASVPFVEVRGTGIEDAASCRCSFAAVSKFKWNRLKAAGASIANGYPDVPSIDELATQGQPQPEPEAPARIPAAEARAAEPLPQARYTPSRQSAPEAQPTLTVMRREPAPLIRMEGPAPQPGELMPPREPLARVQAINANFRTLDFADISAGVQDALAKVSKAEAIQYARTLGVTASGRADAIERIARLIRDRKETWERVQAIGTRAPVAPVTTRLPFELQMPTGEFATRVQVRLRGDAVIVSPFSAGAPDIVIQQGGAFQGWTWNELRAMGDGYFAIKPKSP